MPGVSFFIGPIVVGECKKHRTFLDELIEGRMITLLDDDAISASHYLKMLQQFGLGEGETECLAVCATSDFHMACDDKKARGAAITLFGDIRISGSLTLLKRCVQAGKLSSDEANRSVELMKRCGAFLPEVGKEFFLNDQSGLLR